MSDIVTTNIYFEYGTASDYMVSESNKVKIDYNVFGNQYAIASGAVFQSGGGGYARYNDTALAILFPTATCHPFKLHLKWSYQGGDNTYARFVISDAEVDKGTGTSGTTLTREADFTTSTITGASRSSAVKWHVYKSGLNDAIGIRTADATFYYYKCYCSATAGPGIASATVSASEGYQGDSVTFSCTVNAGETFAGWYNENGLVSTSQNYTVTLGQTDLFLTARKVMAVHPYIKVNNDWKEGLLYQKVNGVWQVVNSDPGIAAGAVLTTKPTELYFNKVLPKSGAALTVVNDWVTTPLIPITPNTDLIVQACQSTTTNNMFNTYYDNKSYFDWWSDGSGEVIVTVDDLSTRKRALAAAKVGSCYWTRANTYIKMLSYMKIWSNGTLVFDGSTLV